jgi:hypothetical protein
MIPQSPDSNLPQMEETIPFNFMDTWEETLTITFMFHISDVGNSYNNQSQKKKRKFDKKQELPAFTIMLKCKRICDI